VNVITPPEPNPNPKRRPKKIEPGDIGSRDTQIISPRQYIYEFEQIK